MILAKRSFQEERNQRPEGRQAFVRQSHCSQAYRTIRWHPSQIRFKLGLDTAQTSMLSRI